MSSDQCAVQYFAGLFYRPGPDVDIGGASAGFCQCPRTVLTVLTVLTTNSEDYKVPSYQQHFFAEDALVG